MRRVERPDAVSFARDRIAGAQARDPHAIAGGQVSAYGTAIAYLASMPAHDTAFDPPRVLRLEVRTEAGMVWFAEAVAAALDPLPETGLLIDLRGDLGAGKTTWTRALAHALGVPTGTRVVSPTFTLIRSYPLVHPSIEVLQHFDAYRLEGISELADLGFDELCGAGCLTCVEWGERIESELPGDRMRIEISVPVHAPVGLDEQGCVMAPSERTVAVHAGGVQSALVHARVRGQLATRPYPASVSVRIDGRSAPA